MTGVMLTRLYSKQVDAHFIQLSGQAHPKELKVSIMKWAGIRTAEMIGLSHRSAVRSWWELGHISLVDPTTLHMSGPLDFEVSPTLPWQRDYGTFFQKALKKGENVGVPHEGRRSITSRLTHPIEFFLLHVISDVCPTVTYALKNLTTCLCSRGILHRSPYQILALKMLRYCLQTTKLGGPSFLASVAWQIGNGSGQPEKLGFALFFFFLFFHMPSQVALDFVFTFRKSTESLYLRIRRKDQTWRSTKLSMCESTTPWTQRLSNAP